MTHVMKASVLCLSAMLLAAPIHSSRATDLGIEGTVFPIIEDDLIAAIKGRLTDMEKSGELAQHQEEFKARARRSIEEPKKVEGVTKAVESRSWLFDPSVVLEQDLVDGEGRVFYRAGTKVNPLTYQPMTQTLLFVQGSDAEQVEWAFTQASGEGRYKIIFVDGRPLDVMRSRKQQVFFDQGGFLVGHFGLSHVPARISQQGARLLVEEVAL